MPRLSIVIPAYNAGQTIGRAVRSVLDSTLRDFELLVIDDGSADATLAVVQGIDDKRIRILAAEHRGVAHAANLGTRESRAPFIARMDADDFCHPERFEKQLPELESGQLDVIGGQVRIVDARGTPVSSMKRYENWVNANHDDAGIKAYRFVESPLVNPTTMARREVLELGFQDGPFPEDYDFWLRAMAHGYRFAKLPDLVLDWTDDPGRLTRSHPNYSLEAFDRCRRTHLLNGPLKEVTRVNLWGAGQTGKPWLRWLQGQDIGIDRVVEVSPKKIGQRIHGVPVVPQDDLPPPGKVPLIIAVGAAGARDLIAQHLQTAGYHPGQDAWFVA